MWKIHVDTMHDQLECVIFPFTKQKSHCHLHFYRIQVPASMNNIQINLHLYFYQTIVINSKIIQYIRYYLSQGYIHALMKVLETPSLCVFHIKWNLKHDNNSYKHVAILVKKKVSNKIASKIILKLHFSSNFKTYTWFVSKLKTNISVYFPGSSEETQYKCFQWMNILYM